MGIDHWDLVVQFTSLLLLGFFLFFGFFVCACVLIWTINFHVLKSSKFTCWVVQTYVLKFAYIYPDLHDLVACRHWQMVTTWLNAFVCCRYKLCITVTDFRNQWLCACWWFSWCAFWRPRPWSLMTRHPSACCCLLVIFVLAICSFFFSTMTSILVYAPTP